MDYNKTAKKHFNIVSKFMNILNKSSEGVLLTGSTAWGANYAITPSSDIDLVVLVKNLDRLNEVIKLLINNKLIEKRELNRLKKFNQLHKKKKVENFSLISNNFKVPVSIDFLFPDTLKKIISLKETGNKYQKGIKVRTVKEFRYNKPRLEGYSLDGLLDKRKIMYHPKFKEIKNNGNVLGYISETLVDGLEENNYFLGVISFFFSISPLILLDKKNKLNKAVKILQYNITNLIKNKIPIYITRQERMSKSRLNKIKKSLEF